MKKVVFKMIAILLLVIPVVSVFTGCGKIPPNNPQETEVVGKYTIDTVTCMFDENTNETLTLTLTQLETKEERLAELNSKQNKTLQETLEAARLTTEIACATLFFSDKSVELKQDQTAVITDRDGILTNASWIQNGINITVYINNSNVEQKYTIEDNKLIRNWGVTFSNATSTFMKNN